MPRQARPSRDPARSQIPDAPRATDAAAASSAVRAVRPCARESFTRIAARLPVCAVPARPFSGEAADGGTGLSAMSAIGTGGCWVRPRRS